MYHLIVYIQFLFAEINLQSDIEIEVQHVVQEKIHIFVCTEIECDS